MELAARSAFSLLDGASTPEALAARAARVGMPALGMADAFDLGGAVRFARACRGAGVRPLLGAEVFVRPDRPFVLLCRDVEGWRNLASLVTEARRSRPRGEPRLTAGALMGRTEGLLCLVRVSEGEGWTEGAVRSLAARFPAGDCLLALEHHGLPEDGRRAARWIELADRTGIPWVPGNAPRYAAPGDRIVHDVLTCLRHDTTLDEAGDRLLPNGEWYLKSGRQMAARWCFGATPESPGSRAGGRARGSSSASPALRGGRSRPAPSGTMVRQDQELLADPPLRFGSATEDPRTLPPPIIPDRPGGSADHRRVATRAGGAGEDGARRADRAGEGRDGGVGPASAPTPCDCAGCEGMRRTLEVAERCHFRIEDLRPRLPAFPVPGGGEPEGFLRALVEQGARERYGEPVGEAERRQLEHELGIIGRLGLVDYFLIVWDIVRFARRRGILVQGRGSAANSAVCYCLGITAVDPVGMDLLFERFLSEERGEAPDIDLDIAHRDREEVLQYVYGTWGRDRAAMVCESITYRGRLAVRDAARVLGFPQEASDRLSAEVDRGEASDAAARLADGGAARAGLDPDDRRTRALIRAVRGMDRLPRHRSIHVGGFVLSDRPLGEVVPIEDASMEERTVIQWDKDDLEDAGLIKFDLLGLGMLTVLGDALAAVRRTRGWALDLAGIPADDPAVYEVLCAADTVGVFQVESRAQMNTLPRVKPRCFYDLVIEVALIRPGPIQGDMVHPYLRRRRGEEPVTYLDPRLEPVLARTLGVPLFQEQGMKVAVALAGFTPAQADRLRRAMGFKRSEPAMREVGRELEAGLARNGVPPDVREKIFKQLTAFSSYGFPESHAASFALLVYASAWLKLYAPPEFYAAMLNAQPMGFYSPSTLVHDARRHGVEVRPIDLARSAWDSTLEPGEAAERAAAPPGVRGRAGPPHALRLGLRLVRGLGPAARERLERAREEGPFASVEDVVRRTGLGEAELRALAEAGAFRSLWPGRRAALWELLRRLRGDAGPLAPRRPEPGRPRAGAGAGEGGEERVEGASRRMEGKSFPLAPLGRAERIAADYRATGLSAEGHPMECLREELARAGVLSAAALRDREDGDEVRVAGIAICRQRPGTARGVTFMTLEDETGFANFVVMPDVRERFQVELRSPLLLAAGRVEREGEVINVLTHRIEPLVTRAGAGRVPSRDYR
ncbi:MAG: error-prone DNA polymerase [Candidatus Palauibacterales bacterium]|nr:error-prone DNA polymerase [Candidatus Palauibacterales bacterium]MDP2584136.1 error-prone DNA polymerase [Candidatus Palauibacterales bacterium]